LKTKTGAFGQNAILMPKRNRQRMISRDVADRFPQYLEKAQAKAKSKGEPSAKIPIMDDPESEDAFLSVLNSLLDKRIGPGS
jgi:hypothetical protein